MLNMLRVPGKPMWIPRVDWRRLLIGIVALAWAAIEKHGEYLAEMEDLLGPYGIVDSIE